MPTIHLEKVSKYYKEDGKRFSAVQDINLEITQGEFVFLIGSRGAGKSTLLHLIGGEVNPSAGIVRLGDNSTSTLMRFQREHLQQSFGMVRQESRLVRTETVMKNLRSEMRPNGQLRPKNVDNSLISKSLGLVGMGGCEQRYPLELSIAECRKIELAKAIIHSPHILILDDITDRLDDDSIWDILHLLSELNWHGTTILMSTRSKRFVNIMRRRVVTLSDGKIIGDVLRGKFGDIV